MAHRIATQWYSGLALVIAGAWLVLALIARSPEAPAADAARSVPAISGVSLSSVAACPVSGDLVGDGNPADVAAVLCPHRPGLLPSTIASAASEPTGVATNECMAALAPF